MSLAEQLGNVGSEYGRARKWKQLGDARFQKAFERFLELLDMTVNDPRLGRPGKREVLRVREESCREFTEHAKEQGLEKYFDQFAFLARKER